MRSLTRIAARPLRVNPALPAEPFRFQHRTANSPFSSPHITYSSDRENLVIYQRSSCWVMVSFILMTSLIENALILQREVGHWSMPWVMEATFCVDKSRCLTFSLLTVPNPKLSNFPKLHTRKNRNTSVAPQCYATTAFQWVVTL